MNATGLFDGKIGLSQDENQGNESSGKILLPSSRKEATNTQEMRSRTFRRN
jgi:hypothetical protein